MAIKILIFDYRETEHKFFEENKFSNYDIKFFDYSLTEETVNNIDIEDLNSTFIISVFIDSMLTKNVIEKFKNLRIISTRSTGYDHINKNICVQRNIAVINVQNYGETTVAQYTMALILALVRGLPKIIKNYNKEFSFVCRDLEKLSIGIVGTGAIGSAVCKLAHAFGMKIFAYDLNPKKELINKFSINYVSLEDLIKNSDIVSLHVPYTGDNYHMFSQKEFELMKNNSYFINISRGEVVNLKYLKEQMENGKILGAGLDVVACECVENCSDFAQKMEVSSLDCMANSLTVKALAEMENVIISPHIAYQSQDAIDFILQETFNAISDIINGGQKNRII